MENYEILTKPNVENQTVYISGAKKGGIMGNSYDSNEKTLKRVSYDSNDRKTNCLSVEERDYMISKVVEKFGIIPQFRPAVAKAANYLTGARFWEIYESAERAKSPARYFIKAINREMYS